MNVRTNQPHPAILIVEDEPEIGMLLRRVLAGMTADIDLLVATNAAVALDLLATHHVELMVTDYRMPGMNGLELAALCQWQANPPAVIIVTGMVPSTFHNAARAVGVNAVLTKPFTVSALEQEVRAALTGRVELARIMPFSGRGALANQPGTFSLPA